MAEELPNSRLGISMPDVEIPWNFLGNSKPLLRHSWDTSVEIARGCRERGT
jgi:hypothetical protein